MPLTAISTVLDNAEQLEELFVDINAPLVLALVDHRGAAYLIASNEDGDLIYQGLPHEIDAGETDDNRGLVGADDGSPSFPVTALGVGTNI